MVLQSANSRKSQIQRKRRARLARKRPANGNRSPRVLWNEETPTREGRLAGSVDQPTNTRVLKKNVTSDHAHTLRTSSHARRLAPRPPPPRGGGVRRFHPRPPALKLAVAGAASLSLLAGAVPDALATTSPALDASALYQKVEPQRASKSRFAGTEAEALKNKKLGKAAPAPKASSSSAPKASASKKAAKKAAKKKDNGGSAGALAAVVALGGVFAANASRGDGSGSSGSSAGASAAKPPAAAGRHARGARGVGAGVDRRLRLRQVGRRRRGHARGTGRGRAEVDRRVEEGPVRDTRAYATASRASARKRRYLRTADIYIRYLHKNAPSATTSRLRVPSLPRERPRVSTRPRLPGSRSRRRP